MLFENDEHQVLAQNEVLGDVLVSVTGIVSQSADTNVCKTASRRADSSGRSHLGDPRRRSTEFSFRGGTDNWKDPQRRLTTSDQRRCSHLSYSRLLQVLLGVVNYVKFPMIKECLSRGKAEPPQTSPCNGREE